MNVHSKTYSNAAIALIAAVLTAAPIHAEANTIRYYTGHECHPLSEDDAGVEPWSEGCVNETSTCGDNAAVRLPISGRTTGDINLDSATVHYYDGTTLAAVECAILVFNTSGSYYVSSYVNSGSLGTGYGFLNWASGSLPNSGSNITSVASSVFQCTLPAKKQSGACTTQSTSIITSYSTNTVDP
jgi:hypothetical protein